MKNRLIICFFFLLLLSGLAFQVWGHSFDLYGISAQAAITEDLSGTLDGAWQTEAESVLNDNLVLRSWLIPLRNQISYSVFRTSAHDSIVLGKENYLYEENYILKELQIIPPVSDEEMDLLADRLTLLRDRLAACGKNLFVFITPSKAHIYPEYIPDSYVSLAPEQPDISTYSKLLSLLNENSILYYDSIPFVLEAKDTADYPVYPTTGVHWSRVQGFAVTQKLMDSMEEQLGVNLPEFELTWSVTPTAIEPDRDAEQLLNLFHGQDAVYYAPGVTITDAEGDSLSALVRGGSFMGTSVYHMMDFEFFTSTYYMENTQLIDQGQISTFTSYEELPLAQQLDQADIVLLEVNEEAIDRMGFGFIEYLLDNILTD